MELRTVDAEKLITGRDGGNTRPVARDLANAPDAMELSRLERILEDTNNQPGWRAEADKSCDYYDGKQLDAETIAKLRERGLGELSQNLIKPSVDAVLGLEAKTRTDWMVMCPDDAWQDVVDAMNAKLKEAETETRADRACSDAYAGQVKAGFHVVEVSRQTNPFEYPYRVVPVHRREIYWDWHSQHPTWDDGRYVVRKRWNDADVVAAFFPKYADLIMHSANGWAGSWSSAFDFDNRRHELLQSGQEVEARTRIEDLEWRDSNRGRVCVFEVWYRTYHRGAVLWMPDGRKVEYDSANPIHIALVASGQVQPRVGVFDRIRLAYFVGPHRVADMATNRRRFPYIPFWGYREDLTAAPYGLIRSMLSPQDEVNARRAKMMWLLSAKRILIDADALDTKYNSLTAASRELARADAFVVLNSNRANAKDGIRIDENMELAEQQFKLLMEAKSAVQEAGGIYAAMMGQNSNATTGVAIQSLIEQGTMTLAEINDNYFHARRQVGDALVELIKEDMSQQINQQMMVESGLSKRRVQINVPMKDEQTGLPYLQNDISRAPMKVQLTDVPSTPTFRAMQFTQLAEITKSLPPQMQAFVAPFIIEASELPKRRELAQVLRKQLGMDIDPNTPEGQQALKEMAETQKTLQNLQMRELASKIGEIDARAQKSLADAAKIQAEIGAGDTAAMGQIANERNKLLQEIAALQGEMVQIKAAQAGSTMQAQIKAEADVETARIKAEGEERVSQIEQEAQLEISRISAEAQSKVDALMQKLVDLERKFADEIAKVQQEAKDREAAAREKEALDEAEDAREEAEKAKKEAEEKKKEAEDEKEDDGEKEPPQPMVVVIPAEKGGKRRRTITFKNDDKGALIGADVEEDDED